MQLELPKGLTLYFARHGQTQANVEHRFSGNKDTPLTALGLEQAAQVGHILKRELGTAPGYQFISSPLARAVATMAIARRTMGLPAEGFATDNRLKEIDLGVWDQLTDDEARALSPSLFEQREVIREHYRLAAEIYGPEVCGRQMRKFGIKYSQLHPQARLVRDAFIAVRRAEDWPQVLDRYYAEDLPGCYPAPEEGAEESDCMEAA